ncbi:hypothetical protein [Fictibacillus barbaricus]|jgi:hypothetical protein|nr:hypothetical protein [Fictibacillus barbaricus]GGB65417.1 hypothetical protein GCM10007199_34590 [Fictibacillus barbaricus]
MPHLLRFIVIGLFSISALSVLSFQAVEIFYAVTDMVQSFIYKD